MIIKETIHTYKESFPIIRIVGQKVYRPRGYDLHSLWDSLIIELSEISKISKYFYVARHTDDQIPDLILAGFKNRFLEFVECYGKNSRFGVPTVWLVIYVEDEKSISKIKTVLHERDIKYFEGESVKYESIEKIPRDNKYTTTANEAKEFPKFLHQITHIAVDLIKTSDSKNKLRELGCLEGMIGNNIEFKIRELKDYLENSSQYYRDYVSADEREKSGFWMNFRRVHGVYSWPHFLFNAVGIS